MIIKTIIDEDFINYKKTSMFIATCYCDWKCLKEQNLDLTICQNHILYKQTNIEISNEKIISRYLKNPITQAIVIAGLEPILQFNEIIKFIAEFREVSNDDIVIYTGYYPEEIEKEMQILKQFKNIVIKFGRYKHENSKRFDEILGVWLISDNQFAKKIS